VGRDDTAALRATTSASVYARHALAQIPRLISHLDREPQSLNYGSLDRGFWAWKFRDCAVTMFQSGIVPLAYVWHYPLPENSWHKSNRLLEWIAGALEHLRRMQNKDGSFNVWGPGTRNPGVGLALALVACKALEILEPHLDARLAAGLREMMERACNFGLDHEEDYAFISNHQAHFALAFLSAGELLGKPRFRERASEIVERILAAQSPDGWYTEYGGPDPGYESLGISYLAAFWQRTRSSRLLDSLGRSVEFFSYCAHPDGSVGGAYGSRHTQQYFPAGFELLSAKNPLAASVARFLRERLERGNIVTPASVDAENLAVFAENYLEACLAPPLQADAPLPPLPCESFDGVQNFPASGITFAGRPTYYAVVNGAKGGACRVFDRRTGNLAYEDAGYIVSAGGRRWTSQRQIENPASDRAPAGEARTSVAFTEVRPDAMSPLRFVLFRLACLTIFRSRRLGAWLQRHIVARLITASRKGPLRLERRVRFGENEIEFSDRIELERQMPVSALEITRSFTAIHMGSSRYYHPAELEETPLPDLRGVARELEARRAASWIFRLRFSAGARPELLLGAASTRAEAPQQEGRLTRP
jgi:hypothetical protein